MPVYSLQGGVNKVYDKGVAGSQRTITGTGTKKKPALEVPAYSM